MNSHEGVVKAPKMPEPDWTTVGLAKGVIEIGDDPKLIREYVPIVGGMKAYSEKKMLAMYELGRQQMREECIAAVENERLTDDNLQGEDLAYERALDHVTTALKEIK